MLSKRRFAPLIGALVVLSVGLLGEYGFRLEKMRALSDQRSKVAYEIGQFRAMLESQLNATLYLANGLVAYVKSHPALETTQIRSMLKTLYEQGNHIRNIGLAPGNRLTYVYPVEGNEKAIGLYYPDLPDQWPAVQRTINGQAPILAGPLQLKQGGVGLIYRYPIFVGVDHRYWGLLSMVLDQESLFSMLNIAPRTNDLKLSLRGRNGKGTQGEVFMGDASLFSMDSIKATIRLPGGTWQSAAIPVDGWTAGQREYWLRVAGWVVGLLLGLLLNSTFASVARRLRAEKILKQSRDDLNEAQRMAMIGSWVLDLRSDTLSWSDETFRIFEVDPAKFSATYDAFKNAIHPEDHERVEQAFNDAVEHHKPYDIVHRLLFADGRIKYVRERCETQYDDAGNPIISRGTVQDVTKISQAEDALRLSEERWKFALEGAGHGVWDWNLQTGEMYLSKQEMTVLGFDGEEAILTSIDEWCDRQHPDDVDRRRKALEQYFSGEAPFYTCEFRMKSRDGHWVWILARGMLVSRTEDGEPLRMIGTHTDVTERKRAEEKLERLANTDPLTGVSNRRCFLAAVEDEILRVQRTGRSAALLMMDIDYFKHVNDKYGHAVGDEVLMHIATLSTGVMRHIDCFGRLGGEEFAFLLPETDSDGAMVFATRLQQAIAVTPTRSSSGEVAVTVSIGVALTEPDGSTIESLLSGADKALYRAKECGRNRVVLSRLEYDDSNIAAQPEGNQALNF